MLRAGQRAVTPRSPGAPPRLRDERPAFSSGAVAPNAQECALNAAPASSVATWCCSAPESGYRQGHVDMQSWGIRIAPEKPHVTAPKSFRRVTAQRRELVASPRGLPADAPGIRRGCRARVLGSADDDPA